MPVDPHCPRCGEFIDAGMGEAAAIGEGHQFVCSRCLIRLVCVGGTLVVDREAERAKGAKSHRGPQGKVPFYLRFKAMHKEAPMGLKIDSDGIAGWDEILWCVRLARDQSRKKPTSTLVQTQTVVRGAWPGHIRPRIAIMWSTGGRGPRFVLTRKAYTSHLR